jgi:putative membrane protein
MDGFLGTRASVMLDVVFVAMFAVVPVMCWSIYEVKYRRRYGLHKRVQVILAAVLLATVTAFEIDMQFFTDWKTRAEASPYFYTLVKPALWIHLFFAVPTAVIWIITVWHALRNIPDPPAPSAASARHIFLGRLAAWEMTGTAVTGWIFYWLAFVA